jgi:small-conductance mechanosensitive channel
MTDTQRELHEVRQLLQGALEDNTALKRDLAVAEAGRLAAEQRLEDVTAHRDRLLREKEQFNQWTLGDVAR